jgi:ABC-type Fe3+ transport system substrate-binding protein
MKAVNAGEIEGGVIYHYYYFGDQAKTGENSKNVELHYFKNQDPGAFVSISGGGVLASSKHPKEAQAFLKFITGKGGQDVLKTGDSFEYAVGKGAESNPKLVPLADLQAPEGRAVDAEQQEGHRPDDGRPACCKVAIPPKRTPTTAPAGMSAFRGSDFVFRDGIRR